MMMMMLELMRIFALLLLLPSLAHGDPPSMEVLVSRPELSQFVQLVRAVNASYPQNAAIMALFRPPADGMTVLVPDNDAFGKFRLLVGGEPPVTVMSQILKFHLLPEIITFAQQPTEKATLLLNQSLLLSSSLISGGAPLSAAVPFAVNGSVNFEGGTIQVIDSVLRPLFEVQDFVKEQQKQGLMNQMQELSEMVGVNSNNVLMNSQAVDAGWLLVCAFLVFFMQAGFAMYETGCIPAFSTRNVLFKNMLDSAISSLGWWVIGFSISYNEPAGQPIMGSAHFFASDYSKFQYLMFGWGFCATTATIDSGATIGRVKLPVYLAMNFVSGWILYPFFSHWAWGGGFLADLGYIDFAGSGVIHMTGGICGLVAAVLLGPRVDRWHVNENGEKLENYAGSSTALLVMGTFILFFCWFGFNCGSSLALANGGWEVAATAGMNTFLSPSAGVIVMLVHDVYYDGTYSIENTCNAILAGLVSITAGCATSSAGGACLTGIISVPLYLLTSKGLARLCIDDPVDVFAVHGVNGAFGVLAVAFFATDERVAKAGYNVESFGRQLAAQLAGIAAIGLTSATIMFIMLYTLKRTIGIRVSAIEEKVGLDFVYHGSNSNFQDKVRAHSQQMEREKEMKALMQRKLEEKRLQPSTGLRRKLKAATSKLGSKSDLSSDSEPTITGSKSGDDKTKSKTLSEKDEPSAFVSASVPDSRASTQKLEHISDSVAGRESESN